IPALNDPTNQGWGICQHQPVWTKRELPRAVTFQAVRTVEGQQTLLQIPIAWIAFAGSRVAQVGVSSRGIADRSRPGVVEFSCEAPRQTLCQRGLQGVIGRIVVVPVKLQ